MCFQGCGLGFQKKYKLHFLFSRYPRPVGDDEPNQKVLAKRIQQSLKMNQTDKEGTQRDKQTKRAWRDRGHAERHAVDCENS